MTTFLFMTVVSFREFTRNAPRISKLLRARTPLMVRRRMGKGISEHYIVSLDRGAFASANPHHQAKPNWLARFVGAGGRDKKPISVEQEKKEIRKLWLKTSK